MRYDPATGLPREQITELVVRISRALDSRAHPPIGYCARLTELPKVIRTVTRLEYYRLGW